MDVEVDALDRRKSSIGLGQVSDGDGGGVWHFWGSASSLYGDMLEKFRELRQVSVASGVWPMGPLYNSCSVATHIRRRGQSPSTI
jgi:hypothetical protein